MICLLQVRHDPQCPVPPALGAECRVTNGHDNLVALGFAFSAAWAGLSAAPLCLSWFLCYLLAGCAAGSHGTGGFQRKLPPVERASGQGSSTVQL